MENNKVKISTEKYDYLVKLEARVSAVVDMIAHDKYLSDEDILRLIGTDKALRVADNIKAEDEKKAKECASTNESQKETKA